MTLWQIGAAATDVIGRTASQCLLFDLATVDVHPEVVARFFQRDDADPSAPSNSFSQELFTRAILGGIGVALVEPAQHYRDAIDRGERYVLDGSEIGRRAAAGLEYGYQAFVGAVVTTPSEARRTPRGLERGLMAEGDDRAPKPFDRTTLAITAERIQFADAGDPILVEGMALTVRVRIDRAVIAAETINPVERDDLERRSDQNPTVDLGRVDAQQGDTLTVEVVGKEPALVADGPDVTLFSDVLDGIPSTWIGTHRPSRTHRVRLWYRVEESDRKDDTS